MSLFSFAEHMAPKPARLLQPPPPMQHHPPAQFVALLLTHNTLELLQGLLFHISQAYASGWSWHGTSGLQLFGHSPSLQQALSMHLLHNDIIVFAALLWHHVTAVAYSPPLLVPRGYAFGSRTEKAVQSSALRLSLCQLCALAVDVLLMQLMWWSKT